MKSPQITTWRREHYGERNNKCIKNNTNKNKIYLMIYFDFLK